MTVYEVFYKGQPIRDANDDIHAFRNIENAVEYLKTCISLLSISESEKQMEYITLDMVMTTSPSSIFGLKFAGLSIGKIKII